MFARSLGLVLTCVVMVVLLTKSGCLLVESCAMSPAGSKSSSASAQGEQAAPKAVEEDAFTKARRSMVESLRRQGIRDEQVLAAMGQVPREKFVPAGREAEAYSNAALLIGHEQTISRPYIVALMTELVKPSPEKRVLDIGTGSGYQAAVLAALCKQVHSIEIVEPLANEARQRLTSLGYRNVNVRCGDGYHGWPEKGPFDIIVVAAAPDRVPQALIDELAPGGRLVIPIGEDSQKLLLIERNQDGSIQQREIVAVKFVPMTGDAQGKQKNQL